MIQQLAENKISAFKSFYQHANHLLNTTQNNTLQENFKPHQYNQLQDSSLDNKHNTFTSHISTADIPSLPYVSQQIQFNKHTINIPKNIQQIQLEDRYKQHIPKTYQERHQDQIQQTDNYQLENNSLGKFDYDEDMDEAQYNSRQKQIQSENLLQQQQYRQSIQNKYKDKDPPKQKPFKYHLYNDIASLTNNNRTTQKYQTLQKENVNNILQAQNYELTQRQQPLNRFQQLKKYRNKVLNSNKKRFVRIINKSKALYK